MPTLTVKSLSTHCIIIFSNLQRQFTNKTQEKNLFTNKNKGKKNYLEIIIQKRIYKGHCLSHIIQHTDSVQLQKPFPLGFCGTPLSF